ncbi:hypothetical protein BJQ94_10685 [Cryobacterium sp. SO2]|uniref:VOC family protein n=1 Tax=Cryobacterium sp. SO2 TaxID=1897060 RepID=UPI00223DAA2F|nr:VOC family protein [Cryobacterium sp. SO2]WEO75851.1 hypothetical protein BJQ94_10685 [Cryobacterium sp. SO2]
MPAGSLQGLVLETDDLDGDVARLATAGIISAHGSETAPWARFAQITDPDGNGLVLQETAPQP